MDELRRKIVAIDDFPRAGIKFWDITPLLADASALARACSLMATALRPLNADLLLAVESRGFIFGGALAPMMGCGVVMARKAGKLPPPTDSLSYTLEYGADELHVRRGVLRAGHRVVIVDDVLATGGTAGAAKRLVERCGAQVAGVGVVIELSALAGRRHLAPSGVHSLLTY